MRDLRLVSRFDITSPSRRIGFIGDDCWCLFCVLEAGIWPCLDNVQVLCYFAHIIPSYVARMGKSNTSESCSEVNTDNEVRLGFETRHRGKLTCQERHGMIVTILGHRGSCSRS